MFKNISKYSYFSFIPGIMIGMFTVILFLLGIIPVYYLCFTIIGWTLISGLGVAVGYHRVFSHNTHTNLRPFLENILLFCGALSGQGSSITWTAIHRGYHHRHSDTDRDLHSPRRGIYHAFFGWTTKITENNPGFSLRYAGKLLRKPNHLWFHRNHLKIQYLTPLVIAVFDWKLALAAICLPTALSLIQDNLVNIVGHRKSLIGYRNFDTKDNSQNNWILGYLAWGQGWHNNHHYNPGSFDFGTAISNKWWEYDLCRLVLPLLKLGSYR
jgi:stearoyl-CoA desaturase (delta-9 desaturase)